MPSRYFLTVAGKVPSKMSSLTKLREYLKQRREDYGDDDTSFAHLPTFYTGPNTFNHTIRIQAKGGKKSRTISVSMPGLFPIPLYYTVSLLHCEFITHCVFHESQCPPYSLCRHLVG